jgi:hypothetical protein
MTTTKCNISFMVDYTSSSPLKAATATYKLSGSQVPTIYTIMPPPSIGSVITLPDITTPGNYDLTITLTDQNNVTTSKATIFKIGNCEGTPPLATATATPPNPVLPINTAILTGSVTGTTGALSYLWSKLGTQNAIIATPTAQTTQVSGLVLGLNTFQLSVTDSNTTVTTTVTVNVTGLRNAAVSSVSISPTSPKTNEGITATANVSNPDNITGLQYSWSLNGVAMVTSSLNRISFGPLSAGTKTLEVGLVGSTGNHHSTVKKSANFTVSLATGGGGGGSFLAGTLVRMSDGTMQKVENIKLGDELKGSQGIVKVVDIFIYESDAKKYRLNDKEYFVTESHPIMTVEGWKSFDPETTKIKVPSIEVSLLQKGDILIKEDGKQEILDNDDFVTGSNLVYNFGVDKTNDFYANGYLVHNKIMIKELTSPE